MPERDLRSWWEEVREDITEYLRARLQLTRLEAYEKIARVVGVVISFFCPGTFIRVRYHFCFDYDWELGRKAY